MRILDGIDGSTQEAVNFADPTTARALATKAYVDARDANLQSRPVIVAAGPLVLQVGCYYLVDATSGVVELTLPSAAPFGTVYIEKTDASANAVTYLPAPPSAGLRFTDLGGGLFSFAGSAVSAVGDGSFTITDAALTDGGAGTYSVTDATIDGLDGVFSLTRQGDCVELVGSNLTPDVWYSRRFSSGALAGAVVKRDVFGRAQVAAPSAPADIATKAYVDARPPGSSFVFTQIAPSATWVISHFLGAFPSVSVVDASNVQVFGDVYYNDTDTLTVSFTNALSGMASVL